MIWILLTLSYGLLKGGREISKKKAMDTNTVMEVLFIYTLFAFLLVVPRAPFAMGMAPRYYGLILIKSFSIFLAWMLGFHALKHLPVSVYGVLDLSRVVLGILYGVLIFHESLTWSQVLGISLVAFGMLALKFKITGSKEKKDEPASEPSPDTSANAEKGLAKFVVMAFASCIFNSISGLLDKIIMKDITTNQMQFWYMAFLVLFYLIYILVTRTKIRANTFKNKWIWAMAIMFVIGDAALFVANKDASSQVTIMTVVKQSACIVTLIGGKFVFHEKGIAYKVLCASIVLCGIVLCVLKL